ncbi:MAG: hypothetical protein M1825_000760 [Sarcosagium campestre]|nr:MAG: hypothetical protein M1825_000760 [Sarcosagium campestre]
MPAVLTHRHEEGPLVKRSKTDNGDSATVHAGRGSRIFAPFRTIGLVSPTSVPFATNPLGKTTFQVTTSVGNCLQTYDVRRGLNLVFLSRPQTPGIITATTCWNRYVIAAWTADGSGNEDASPIFGVWIFQRGKHAHSLETPAGELGPVRQILVFGSWIVGCTTSKIIVWSSQSHEHYTTITPIGPTIKGVQSALSGMICTMPTFLNKVFAGRVDGSVEMWNVSTGKLIYSILPPSADAGAVTALQPAPALSLLTIAYESGTINIHNVRTDTRVIELNGGSSLKNYITSISFRTDGLGAGEEGRKPGVMATTSHSSCDVTFWDLNDGGRIMGVLRGAHYPRSVASGGVAGGVNKVEFLAGQPVLVTSGLDNSLRTWIFDESPFSAIPRILHSRSGHAAPVTTLQFLPTDADGADAGGKWLLSAGRDRSLWGWSLRRDGQSTELSQGHIRSRAKKMGLFGKPLDSREPSASLEDLKAPEITCIAMSLNRDGGMGAIGGGGSIWTSAKGGKTNNVTDASLSGATGWESIVTGHKDDDLARTWFWGRKKAGRWTLKTGDGGKVTSVGVTACGTFALVGSSAGGIDMFNLQSGIHRKRFPVRLTPAQARALKMEQLEGLDHGTVEPETRRRFKMGQGKHAKAVTGVMSDGTNQRVISCGLDGKVKFWDFGTGLLLDELDWYPITAINRARIHRSNDLLALGCDDRVIRIVDIETARLVRELSGCGEAINDFCFSNDGRWIVAASADSIIRVWDLPTGHLIDGIRVPAPCTSLAFSGTGEFLATAHTEGVGVNIWTNKTLFANVSTRVIDEADIEAVAAPTASGEGNQGPIEAAFDDGYEPDFMVEDGATSIVDQLSADMTTLSVVPRSRWQTLLHLDSIKDTANFFICFQQQRNKPKEPPKAPEKAPFFLPSLEGGKTSLATTTLPQERSVDIATERSRITKMDRAGAMSNFTALLRQASLSKEYSPFITYLATLPPASSSLEIGSLERDELAAFVTALTERLRQRRDYELVHTWMAVFLRAYGQSVAVEEDLRCALIEWRAEQEKGAERLGELVGFCKGVVGFLRSGR